MISFWISVVPPKFEMIQKIIIGPGGPDDEEGWPGHKRQQEADLEHDRGQRDQQDKQPGHKRGEHRREGNLQIGVGALPGLAAEVRATLPG